MMKRREDWRPFDNPQGRIRLILLLDWDPIGVFHYQGNMDEYDDYAVKVYEMARANASREEVTVYLGGFQTGRRIRPDELSLSAVVDKLFVVFRDIDEDGSKQAAWEAANLETIKTLKLEWFEICGYLPEQWVLVEAVKAHSEGDKRILDRLTVVETFPDSVQAMQDYARLHHDFPERELYALYTGRETLEITDQTWLGGDPDC